MWHSCSSYPLAYHFEGADPSVRLIYDRFLAVIESVGPIEVIPQKTRIAFLAQVRFAACVVRKRWRLANLWLTRRINHPKLQRVEKFGSGSYGHQFRLNAPEDIDAGLVTLIEESYDVGLRKHLKRA